MEEGAGAAEARDSLPSSLLLFSLLPACFMPFLWPPLCCVSICTPGWALLIFSLRILGGKRTGVCCSRGPYLAPPPTDSPPRERESGGRAEAAGCLAEEPMRGQTTLAPRRTAYNYQNAATVPSAVMMNQVGEARPRRPLFAIKTRFRQICSRCDKPRVRSATHARWHAPTCSCDSPTRRRAGSSTDQLASLPGPTPVSD